MIITITCVSTLLSVPIYRKKKINISPPSPSPLQSWSSRLVLVSWWIGSILTSSVPSSWPPDPLRTRITNNQPNGLRSEAEEDGNIWNSSDKTRIPVHEWPRVAQRFPEWPRVAQRVPESLNSPTPRGRESAASFLNQSLVSDISPDSLGWNNRAGVFISQQYWSPSSLPSTPTPVGQVQF